MDVFLVNIGTGYTYSGAHKVENLDKITKTEMGNVCGGDVDRFEAIK